MIAKFRLVSYAEAVTFLLLLIGVFIKRVLESTDVFVTILGPVHGIVFLVYLVLVFKVRPSQGWTLGQTILVIVASALPFGGFFVGNHLVDEPTASAPA